MPLGPGQRYPGDTPPMPLTAFAIDRTKPQDKAFKLADGGGLFLLVQPNGSKLWRLRYFYLGKERTLSIGPYPIVSLADARAKREQAKRLLLGGTDPSVQKKLDRIAAETASRNTFGLLAAEYIERLEANGAAAQTLKKNRWFLQELCRPIEARPIAEITPAEILDLLKRIEKSGRRETARRMRGVIGSVFRLAIVTLRATSDPSYALQGALLKPNAKPRAAITDERQFGGLLRAIDEFDGWPTIKAALQFSALTFCAARRDPRRKAFRDRFPQGDLAHSGRTRQGAPPPRGSPLPASHRRVARYLAGVGNGRTDFSLDAFLP